MLLKLACVEVVADETVLSNSSGHQTSSKDSNQCDFAKKPPQCGGGADISSNLWFRNDALLIAGGK